MKQSTKDKLSGKLNQAAGKGKEKLGRATRDPDLTAEGQSQQLRGKVENKVGDIKKVFNK